jgi:phage shock protein E
MFGLFRRIKLYGELDAARFEKAIAVNPEAVILDVRTPGEYTSGHIPKALNVNLMDFSFTQQISRLDKSKTYLVYCRSGNRSGQACALMTKQGFTDVHHLMGGLAAWTGAIRR